MTVVSVLELHVREGAGQQLIRRFADLEIFERSRDSGGFLGGRLLRPLAEGGSFLVVAEWESAAAYQAWLDSPVRAELGGELEPLLLAEPGGADLFEEAVAGR